MNFRSGGLQEVGLVPGIQLWFGADIRMVRMLQHRGTVQREKWEYILGTELNKSTRSKK
jgi:hypothetical protein